MLLRLFFFVSVVFGLPSLSPPPPPFEAYQALRAAFEQSVGLQSRFRLRPGAHNRSRGSVITISQFSNVYGLDSKYAAGRSFGPSCPHRCALVPQASAPTADAVILSAAAPPPAWPKPPGQLWVGVYFESPDHYPLSRDVARYNLTMGFSPFDDELLLNMIHETFKHFEATSKWAVPTWEEKRRSPLMSVWMSNCGRDTTGRAQTLIELAALGVTMASYGRCMKSAEPVANWSEEWSKFATIGDGELLVASSIGHLFFFAGENSFWPWYGMLIRFSPSYILKLILP